MKNFKNLAASYLVQADEDIRTAGQFLREKKYPLSLSMSAQSAINALSSVCLSNNRLVNPVFSTSEMNGLCIEFSHQFQSIQASCEAMDEIHQLDLIGVSDTEGLQNNINEELAVNYLEKAKEIYQCCSSFLTELS